MRELLGALFGFNVVTPNRTMVQNFTQLAFTDSVKAEQEHYGSRISYQRLEKAEKYKLGPREEQFISERDGLYLSTVGENGWPYVQFRGGSKGFLKVLDEETLAYADFKGNMQYISTGNLKSTKKASFILLDYATKTRLKVWAETEILYAKDNPDLLEKLSYESYKASIERIVVFKVKGFDWNCPQHIIPKFTLGEIKELIKENEELKSYLLE